jgi:molybdopterin-dependent oxidoreductase alpha subunit
LQIKINGDLALLKIINHLLIQKEREFPGEILDTDFISQKSSGFEDFRSENDGLDIETLLKDTNLEINQVNELVELLSFKKKIIVCWAMGLTQHKNSVATIQEIVNLLLLKGSIGIEGGGTCPVRGHLNAAIEKNFGFTPPQNHGYDVVESIEAMFHKKAKVFFALGGNFLSASPDTEFTAEALKSCRISVQVSTKLNRSHLIHGETALILPCLGRTDKDVITGNPQFVSTENSMGVVQKSQGVLDPVSDDLLGEPTIIAKLAKATLGTKYNIAWEEYAIDYARIRKDIANTIDGFKNYEQNLNNDGGFYLPNGPREGVFTTENKKANFTVNKYAKIQLKENEFLMMTIRSHDQFNTTIYGLDDRYRGIYNERRIVFVNPLDINDFGLETYEKVNLVNEFGGRVRIAEKFIVVPYNIPRTCIATYFPEANVLVPIDSMADGSQTPTSKSVVVRIEKL